MTTTSQTNRPTHRAFFVSGDGDNKQWIELGPVWSHNDGKGFNLVAHVLPAPGQTIVIRANKPADASENGGQQ
ncbi:MAG: hypothetical protein KJ622_13535 [Alphaproteobacteria bacterium]|nr:hypothetical protein [Alphaproteobacteria bacterium]